MGVGTEFAIVSRLSACGRKLGTATLGAPLAAMQRAWNHGNAAKSKQCTAGRQADNYCRLYEAFITVFLYCPFHRWAGSKRLVH